MAPSGRTIRVPEVEEVVGINRRRISKYGGFFAEPDNLLNPGSLHWVLQVVQYPVFGHDPYPTLAHKAAIIARTIIVGHVFCDGNKRTGMATAILFLQANGYDLDVSQDELVQVALDIANHLESGMTIEPLIEWFEQHMRWLPE
jgi:death-on-curing protein